MLLIQGSALARSTNDQDDNAGANTQRDAEQEQQQHRHNIRSTHTYRNLRMRVGGSNGTFTAIQEKIWSAEPQPESGNRE